MCGIAGIIGRATPEDIQAMTRALTHRGPDDEGFFFLPESGVWLGHRRLSILDQAHGRQPFATEDGQTVIVYNGEIYNHLELRRELESRGHRFRSSHSDTETLLRGYLEWGADLPGRLNGMFAFAVLDLSRRRLLLARDRFGEKPLYYCQTPQGFAFASEIQALAIWPGFKRELDLDNLQRFLAWGYLTGERTLYRHCRKLPGGGLLNLDIRTGEAGLSRYWKFQIEPDEGLTDRDEPRLIEELRGLLVEAVRRRLISDVPLGMFLSGGIDSSAVLAAMAQVMDPERIEAFTIGFTDSSFDESSYARTAARAFGVRHHLRILDLDQARSSLPEVLPRLGEPLGDSSILPTFLLSRLAREHVTVALSGDGGDEMFAGYDPFMALTPAAWYARFVPRIVHRALRYLAGCLPLGDANMSFDFKLRRTLRGLSYPREQWLPIWMGPLEPTELRYLFARPLPVEALFEETAVIWRENSHLSETDRALTFFTEYYLKDDILTKVDRATMLVSLESRAVFLDNDLVDFCRRLPGRFKLRHGRGKYLLRRALDGWLPKSILERPKKGFGIPLNRWLREMDLNLPQRSPVGVHPAYIEYCLLRHRRRQGDHRLFLWSWLSFEEAEACLDAMQGKNTQAASSGLAYEGAMT